MSDVLPQAVQDGLKAARKAALQRNDRLCVHDGDNVYRIIGFWEDRLSLAADDADKLRGRVEIFDGAKHLYQCLIVNSRVEGDVCIFDFKWLHPVAEKPAVDFELPNFVPAGLIARA